MIGKALIWFGRFSNKFDHYGDTHKYEHAMRDTPTLLFIRILVDYILHILGVEYIPYSFQSSCNNFETLISSEEVYMHNYNLGLYFTPPGGLYSH